MVPYVAMVKHFLVEDAAKEPWVRRQRVHVHVFLREADSAERNGECVRVLRKVDLTIG